MLKDDDDALKAIANDKENDRLYIRKLFDIGFGTNFLKEHCEEGKDRSKFMKEIESTAIYHTMKGD